MPDLNNVGWYSIANTDSAAAACYETSWDPSWRAYLTASFDVADCFSITVNAVGWN